MPASVLQQVPHETHGALHPTEAVTLTCVAGSPLHVCFTFDNSNGTTDITVASVPSLTWTKVDTQTDGLDSEVTQQWVASPFAAGGSITVTATFVTAQTGHSGVAAKEIGGSSGYMTGIHASNQQATPTTNPNAVTTGNTPTLTSQPALASSFCMDSAGGGTPAVGTGFTDDGAAWSGFTGTNLMRGESQRVTSTAALAATYTAAANDTNQSFVAIFAELVVPPTTGQLGKQLYVMP